MIKYIPYDNVYKEQIIELLSVLWPISKKEKNIYFEWKYLNNPITSEPLIFLALDSSNNKVVGIRGYFVAQYFYKGEKINVAAHSDAIVHPDYRGRGVFEKMTRFAMEVLEKKQLVHFYNTISNDSWPTSKGYLKMGSVPIGEKKIMYKISPLKGLLIKENNYCEVSQEKEVDFIYELRKHSCLDKLSLNYTKEFTNWRYSNPVSNYYFVYAYDKDNTTPLGYITFYKISSNRIFILDYFYTDTKVFSTMLKEIINTTHCFLIQTWSISRNPDEIKTLKRNGFYSFDKIIRKIKKEIQPPILIRPVKREYDTQDFFVGELDVRLENNWDIQLICSDGI